MNNRAPVIIKAGDRCCHEERQKEEKLSQQRVPAEYQPREYEKDQDDDCDHDLQVRYPFCPSLDKRALRARDISPTRGSCPAAFPVGYSHSRPGLAVPQCDIDAVMVGRQPALCAVMPPAVLAGERESHFVSTAIAPGHYFSMGSPGIKDSVTGKAGYRYGNRDLKTGI